MLLLEYNKAPISTLNFLATLHLQEISSTDQPNLSVHIIAIGKYILMDMYHNNISVHD